MLIGIIIIVALVLLVRWFLIRTGCVNPNAGLDLPKPRTEVTSDPYYTYKPDADKLKKMRERFGFK